MSLASDIARAVLRSLGLPDALAETLRAIEQQQVMIMATLDDIKAAETDFGAQLDALVALVDKIFAALQSAPDQSPAIQAVLDMIAAHKQTVSDAIARDTPAGG